MRKFEKGEIIEVVRSDGQTILEFRKDAYREFRKLYNVLDFLFHKKEIEGIHKEIRDFLENNLVKNFREFIDGYLKNTCGLLNNEHRSPSFYLRNREESDVFYFGSLHDAGSFPDDVQHFYTPRINLHFNFESGSVGADGSGYNRLDLEGIACNIQRLLVVKPVLVVHKNATTFRLLLAITSWQYPTVDLGWQYCYPVPSENQPWLFPALKKVQINEEKDRDEESFLITPLSATGRLLRDVEKTYELVGKERIEKLAETVRFIEKVEKGEMMSIIDILVEAPSAQKMLSHLKSEILDLIGRPLYF